MSPCGVYVDPVTMSGVNTLNLYNAQAGGQKLYFNASTYGDVHNINVSDQSANIYIKKLDVRGNAQISLAGATNGSIQASGTVDGLQMGISITNYVSNNKAASIANVGASGIDMSLNNNTEIIVFLGHSGYDVVHPVSLGDINIAHININAATSAKADITIENDAYVTGNYNASVGNVTLGNISINPGVGSAVSVTATNSTNDIYIHNYARVTHAKGATTAGTITVGNIVANTGANGYNWLEFSNDVEGASSIASDATGLVKIGNVAMHGSYDAYQGLSINNYSFSDK